MSEEKKVVEEQLEETTMPTEEQLEEVMETLTDEDSQQEIIPDDGAELSKQEKDRVKEYQTSLRDKIMAMNESEAKKSLVTATEKQKKDLYGGQHVIPIDERPGFETVAEQRRSEHLDLLECWRNKKPITGTIYAVAPYPIGGYDCPCAEVAYGTYTIKIPVPALCSVASAMRENLSNAERMRELQKIGNARLGSEVTFYITDIDEPNHICIGNRVEWMKHQKVANYETPYRNKFSLNEGDHVEARVNYVTRHKINMEVFGVDVVLSEKDVTPYRVMDLTDLYSPGDREEVVIKKIERKQVEKNGKKAFVLTNLVVSIRDAKPDERKINFDKIQSTKGTSYLGEVTQRTEAGVFVKLTGMDYDVLCNPPKEFKTPALGTKVIIGILSKDERNLTCKGFIKAIR